MADGYERERAKLGENAEMRLARAAEYARRTGVAFESVQTAEHLAQLESRMRTHPVPLPGVYVVREAAPLSLADKLYPSMRKS
jgi:hypothetical protein